MKLIFVDESGYSPNWTADIVDQPFYVLSAVCIDASLYPRMCDELRRDTALMGLPGLAHPLGKGSEIKARAVARGEGWWQQHNDERNRFRDLMLSLPACYEGVAFVVAVHKDRHRNQYVWPEDPVTLAMKFLFERL